MDDENVDYQNDCVGDILYIYAGDDGERESCVTLKTYADFLGYMLCPMPSRPNSFVGVEAGGAIFCIITAHVCHLETDSLHDPDGHIMDLFDPDVSRILIEAASRENKQRLKDFFDGNV